MQNKLVHGDLSRHLEDAKCMHYRSNLQINSPALIANSNAELREQIG